MGGTEHGAAPAHCLSNAASLQAHLVPRWNQSDELLIKVNTGGEEVEIAERLERELKEKNKKIKKIKEKRAPCKTHCGGSFGKTLQMVPLQMHFVLEEEMSCNPPTREGECRKMHRSEPPTKCLVGDFFDWRGLWAWWRCTKPVSPVCLAGKMESHKQESDANYEAFSYSDM